MDNRIMQLTFHSQEEYLLITDLLVQNDKHEFYLCCFVTHDSDMWNERKLANSVIDLSFSSHDSDENIEPLGWVSELPLLTLRQ